MSNNSIIKEKRNLIIVTSFVAALCITIIFSGFFLKMGHVIKLGGDASLRIHLSEGKNHDSYGRMMIISAIKINDNDVDLSELSTDEWNWFEEYQYIAFIGENEDLVLDIQKNIFNSVEITYYSMEAGGIAEFYFDNELLQTDDLYTSGPWKTKTFSAYGNSPLRVAQILISDFLFIFVLLIASYYLIRRLIFKENYINSISLGTFNCLKGLGLVLVVFKHALNLVDFWGSGYFGIWSLLALVFLYGLMPMYFILAGYGFRRENVITCVKKQLYFFLKPYITLVMFVCIAVIVRILLAADDFNMLFHTLMPFLFLVPTETTFAGADILSMGPTWFFASLCIAWVLTDIIIGLKNVYMRILGIIICVLLAFVCYKKNIQLSILPVAALAVPFICMGYLFKKKKVFTRVKFYQPIIIMIMFLGISLLAANNSGDLAFNALNLGNNFWLGFIISMFMGFFIIYAYLLPKKYMRIRTGLLDKIGYRTWELLYIHTFWYVVISWENVFQKIKGNDWWKVLIVFLLHFALMGITYYFKKKVWDKIWLKKRIIF